MSENNLYEFLHQLKKDDGVYLDKTLPAKVEFESFYLSVRKSEKRLLSDQEVAGLPVLKNNPHTKEWQKRARSAQRVCNYFTDKGAGNMLDLGCGNGWFTSLLAKNKNLEVIGMEVNLTELKQAARVFQKSNLSFFYGDIFHSSFPENTLDFITINAVIQYFEDLAVLIKRLFEVLKPGGEIHFIDSPFYEPTELAAAKKRSVNYYNGKGFTEMSKYYFHHTWLEIADFDPQILYNGKPKKIISKILKKSDMPFPWIKIINRND